jgi:glucosyl-3-phosphoglycerate synthase
MSDFFQYKNITTLQSLRLNKRLEEDVMNAQKKLVVVIPCLVSHYVSGVLQKLLDQLRTVSLISEIIVVLNGNQSEVKNFNKSFTQIKVDSNLIKFLMIDGIGKGRAIKFGFDYAYQHYKKEAILVTLDADLQSFSKEYFLRLVYPIVLLGGHFNKGYYARFSPSKLDGRLTRLLVIPMLYAIQEQHPASDLTYWLLSFRYPLSGDVALVSDVVPHLTLHDNWAYDLSLLYSLYHLQDELSIYQTELTDNYEHLHRNLDGDKDLGLSELIKDISIYLMGLLPLNINRFIDDYENLAFRYCDKYKKLALFNGIKDSNTDNQLVLKILVCLMSLKLS